MADYQISNNSYTLPFAHRTNIARLALNPKGNLLLTVDETGRAILSHFTRRIALYHFSLKSAVSALTFSPSGRHFAVGIGRKIEVWHTPSTPDAGASGELEFAPFVKHREYVHHYDTVQSIEWSSDSRFFLSASKDLTARIWSLDSEEGFVPTTLAGHRQSVVAAWFSKDQETIYTVSKDGALFEWAYLQKPGTEDPNDDSNMQWRISQRHYFLQNNAHLTCAAFDPTSSLLVVGFSNGIFGLYELPSFTKIHDLSISQTDIDCVTVNATGEWLAFGASKTGQLLVWEWQSESHVLKQASHHDAINALTYSPDGTKIITAADDGKIKLWDVKSGFCIATFTEHSSGVTACQYAKRGNVLFTASLDGSVRAWDLVRYRNFRTFTAPSRLSFSCLAVDPSGEVVAAGSLDSFDIHIWSVQTGQLLDTIAGHEGPVSTLAFTPDGGNLVSGSWDHTVRIWSVFARTQTSEPLQLQADVLALTIRPDSKQIAVSTLDGQITFWSLTLATQTSGLDNRRDASGGRKMTDRRTAANVAGTKSFSTLTYSADGTCVLAGGNSKHICLYDVQSGTLLKKWVVSVNLGIEGTQEFLNSRNLTEAGPRGLIDETGEASDLEDRLDRSLPGSKRGGDAGARRTRPEIRVTGVQFSPTGRAFCASSTEGLLVYGLDAPGASTAFDPLDLEIDITPDTTLAMLRRREWLKALVMSMRLNSKPLTVQIYESVPLPDIGLVVRDLPTEAYLSMLIRLVVERVETSPHLEFGLMWLERIMTLHGRFIRDNRGALEPELRGIARAVGRVQRELGNLAEENIWNVDYLLGQKGTVKANKNGFGGVKGNGVLQWGSMDGREDDRDGDVEMGSEDGWVGIEA